VLTDDTSTSGAQVLSVLRVTRPVLGESKVGFIVTNGNPTGSTDNTVLGVDFQYRNSNFLGRYVLQSDAYYQRSFDSANGDDDSAALAFNFPNEPWSGDFLFKQIGANFEPALGFVNRTDMRQYQGSVARLSRYTNFLVHELEFGTEYLFVTDLHDRLESRENILSVRAATTLGDMVTLRLIDSYENVPALFLLPHDVPDPQGRYGWTNVGVRLSTFDGRVISADADIVCCSFYNGSSFDARLSVTYRPSPYFELIPAYRGTFIDLPTGRVDIHLATLDSVLAFTPDMNLALQVQYDNISGNFGLSLRYRWEYEPGNEVFLGIGQSAWLDGPDFLARTTQVSLRVGRTFRF
jgi:hypothetical protein